jgi:hypothetical protein
VNISTLYTHEQLLREVIPQLCFGRPLRRQYQSKAVRRLIRNVLTGQKLGRVRIGCGGGKTYIFILALAYLYATGAITKSVIVAPTIALTRQLENQFCGVFEKLFELMREKHTLKLSKPFTVVNVSSDTPQPDDDELPDSNQYAGIERIVYIDRVDERKAEQLEILLEERDPAAYFVCLKSYKDKFVKCIARTGVQIGVTVFDEFHNLISEEKYSTNDSIKALKIAKTQSKSCWFFSASEKIGSVMQTNDAAMFGQELVAVYSSQLVRWGYLVPNINIDFVNTGSLSGVTESMTNWFEAKKVDVEKLYLEWNYIEHCLTEVVKRGVTPRTIMFGGHVATMLQLLKTPAFQERMEKLFPGLRLYGIFGGEVVCPKDLEDKIKGKSLKEQREAVFQEVRTTDAPFLLFNHSVLKEGIDVTRFNTLLISRGMNEIGIQQAFGRVQRLDEGKTHAHVFIMVQDEAGQRISKKTAELIYAIQYTLGDIAASIFGLGDDRSGDVPDDRPVPVNVQDINIPHLVVSTSTERFQPGKILNRFL